MILEFKTPRNTYGHRKYLAIDTIGLLYAKQSPKMITEGIEIKASDYKDLVISLVQNGYREVEYIQ